MQVISDLGILKDLFYFFSQKNFIFLTKRSNKKPSASTGINSKTLSNSYIGSDLWKRSVLRRKPLRYTFYQISLVLVQLKNTDVVVDSVLLVLSNALGNPSDVSNLLLSGLDPCPDGRVSKLLCESHLAHVHFSLVKVVGQRLVVGGVKHALVVGQAVNDGSHLLHVLGSRQSVGSNGVELAKAGHQRLSVGGGQARAEGVESNVDGPSVGLKVKKSLHDLVRGRGQRATEAVKVLEVGLVQSVSDDLNVELVQLGHATLEAVLEVGGQWGVHKHRVVQRLDVGGHRQSGQRVEPTKRVASLQQLRVVSVVESSCDKQSHVINHVAVGDVVHEFGHGLHGLGSNVPELGNELSRRLFLNGGCGDWRRHIGEKVSVLGGGQLGLEVLQRVALGQVVVVVGLEQTRLVASHQALNVAAVLARWV